MPPACALPSPTPPLRPRHSAPPTSVRPRAGSAEAASNRAIAHALGSASTNLTGSTRQTVANPAAATRPRLPRAQSHGSATASQIQWCDQLTGLAIRPVTAVMTIAPR